jgi:hypothetical protein
MGQIAIWAKSQRGRQFFVDASGVERRPNLPHTPAVPVPTRYRSAGTRGLLHRKTVSARTNPVPTESKPPAAGLAAYGRLDDARNHVRASLHQLCRQIAEADVAGAPQGDTMGVLMTEMSAVLVCHLRTEAALLERLAFPVMDELEQHQRAIVGKLSSLEQSLQRNRSIKSLFDVAHDLRQCVLWYFDWLDEVFCRPPRGYS